MKSLVFFILWCVGWQQVRAKQEWIQLIPNGGNVQRNGVPWPASGHVHPTNPTGESDENNFGEDFEDFGKRWSVAFCRKDSDGDSVSNGAELGDPDCVWTPGAVPNRTYDISHPGYADSRPSGTKPPETLPPPTWVPISTTVSRSALVSVLNGQMKYQWTFKAIDTPNPVLSLTLHASGNFYVSWGIGPSLMNGIIIACYMNGGSAMCSEWNGIGLAISRRATTHTIVSSSQAGSGYSITVDISLDSMGIYPYTTQRAMFAIGSYDTASNTPLQHASTARGAQDVFLFSVVGGGTPPPGYQVPTPPPTPAPPTAPPYNVKSGATATNPSETHWEVGGKMAVQWQTYPSSAIARKQTESKVTGDVIELNCRH